ncbi:MAG: hypothetical protein ACRDT4_06060 [Micromonosporaceae bacterium]
MPRPLAQVLSSGLASPTNGAPSGNRTVSSFSLVRSPSICTVQPPNGTPLCQLVALPRRSSVAPATTTDFP